MQSKTLALSFAVLASAAPASAWAVCSTSLVDLNLITTVTVTAGPNENCEWRDGNPNNSHTVSVAGIVVPAPLLPAQAEFAAHSVANYAYGKVARLATCHTTALPCTETFLLPLDVPIDRPLERYCQAFNTSVALSATATCVFERDS